MQSLPEVAEQARRIPARGLLAFRWLSLSWIVVLVASGAAGRYRPLLSWAAIAVVVAWGAWVTPRQALQPLELWIELAMGAGLIVVAGLVARPGALDNGPSLASLYPVVAAAAWGLARGPVKGVAAGVVLSAALLASRLLNNASLAHPTIHFASLGNSAIGFLLAGGVIGGFSRLVDRTAQALEGAMGGALREQAQLSRLKERESLARQIHDSVLQALALVHKRGRELAASGTVSPADVAELAELARQQEISLRTLILREPQRSVPGQVLLRDVLEPAVNAVALIDTNLSVVGTIWLARAQADELAAAVKEALANVVEHAGASRAAVFAEQEDGVLSVSVRDDGKGFVLDEAALKAANKAGILRSMKGRVEDLGGTIRITSAPGRGTEVEFRIPCTPQGEGR